MSPLMGVNAAAAFADLCLLQGERAAAAQRPDVWHPDSHEHSLVLTHTQTHREALQFSRHVCAGISFGKLSTMSVTFIHLHRRHVGWLTLQLSR